MAAKEAAEDSESDEEIRWENDCGAWEELLACYRRGVAGEETAPQERKGKSALETLSQSTHATQPRAAAASASPACSSRTAADDFLEFFPEWRPPDAATPPPSRPPQRTEEPPRSKKKKPLRNPPHNKKRCVHPQEAVEDPIAVPPGCSPAPTVSQFYPSLQKGEDDLSWGSDEEERGERIEEFPEGLQPEEVLLGVGDEEPELQRRLDRQRKLEAKLEAFAGLALEKHPDANRLPLATTGAKEQWVSAPDPILDVPEPPKSHNPWQALLNTAHGQPVSSSNTSLTTPGMFQAAKRFKVEHAPVRFKSGHLSGFLSGVLRGLAQRHGSWARGVFGQAVQAEEERALKLQVVSPKGGRCLRCRLLQQKGVMIHLLLTTHQVAALGLQAGDELVVYPPYHLRQVCPGRKALFGADILLPLAPTHHQDPDDISSKLAALTNMHHGAQQQQQQQQHGNNPKPVAWKTVEADEWELPQGVWDEISQLLNEGGAG